MQKNTIPKVLALSAVLILSAGLWGCGNKASNTGTTGTSATSEGELFPGVDRTTLVTPSGYADTEAAVGATSATPGSGAGTTNLQIGTTTRIKATKYNLEGIVKIKTVNSVSLESFAYDGTCPGFKLYLTRSNLPALEVVPFNLSNRVYSGETFTINFPSGVTIDNIDAAAMTCSNKTEPIFVTPLE